jgi:high-affinity iron transporter
VLALVAVAVAVAIVAGHGGPRPTRSHRAVASSDEAHRTVASSGKFHVTTVFGSSIPAKQYGTELSKQQGQTPEETTPAGAGLPPVSAAAFAGPIAGYRAYAVHWAATLAGEVPRLSAALTAGDRAGAEREWSLAFSDYLHLGAVYGLLPGTLDEQIDGMPHALPGNGAPTPSFSGLHRIEMGLWTGSPMASLARWATRLRTDVGKLERVLPTVEIDPVDYATRAHEILEDAQRDFLSGADVRWSGAGVLATAAGADATSEVISTLKPLLEQRDGTVLDVDNWLYRLQAVFGRLRSDHGGSWPSLGQLTLTEREEIDATLAGALGPLSQIPGSLETAPTPTIPKLSPSQ